MNPLIHLLVILDTLCVMLDVRPRLLYLAIFLTWRLAITAATVWAPPRPPPSDGASRVLLTHAGTWVDPDLAELVLAL
jgi:hypothetical protein